MNNSASTASDATGEMSDSRDGARVGREIPSAEARIGRNGGRFNGVFKGLRAIISEERVKERTEKIEEIKKKMKR